MTEAPANHVASEAGLPVISSPAEEHIFRILVVDDDLAICHLLVSALASDIVDVISANNGASALERIAGESCDLIILDVMLPDMSGLDLCRKIKADSKHQGAAVIMMSGLDAPTVQVEGIGLGAVDFLSKPFKIIQLRDKVQQYLDKKQHLVPRQADLEKETRQAHRALKETHNLLNALMDHSPTVVTIKDVHGRYLQINQVFKNLFNKSGKSLIGLTDYDIFDKAIADKMRKKDEEVLSSRAATEFEESISYDNTISFYLSVKFPLLDSLQQPYAICTISTDITERKRVEERLFFLATRDSLTTLYNRSYWNDSLASLIREGGAGAVMYLDLDNFKVVNDTLGHAAGDRVLVMISKIMIEEAGEQYVVARFGGDEFVVLLKHASQQEAEEFGNRLQERLARTTFSEAGQNFHLSFSVGIALVDGQSSIKEVMAQADMAGYAAKKKGGDRVEVFKPERMRLADLRHDMHWSQRISEALRSNRFEVWLQPIVRFADRKVAYYETLIRLRDADGDVIGPNAFLPVAERTGAIQNMDRHMIQMSCKLLAKNEGLSLSINLSAQSIDDPSLMDFIEEQFRAYNVEPSRAIFEITETLLVSDLLQARQMIERLQGQGFLFAIDDFGAGFSSIGYLRNLLVDTVKMDGSLIRDIAQDKVNQTLVCSVIQVADLLKMRTVAEYVEDDQAAKILQGLGVHYGQGYFFSPPKPAKVFGLLTT